MRGRRGSAAAVAGLVGLAALLSACGNRPAVFHPGGSLPTPRVPGQASLSRSEDRPSLVFETPLPAEGLQRAVVLGYEEYARSRWAGRTAAGPVRYFNTAVTGVYFGNGAAVSSCVDVAGRRYLEQVAEGRRSDGAWFVAHVNRYPVTSSQGASCQ